MMMRPQAAMARHKAPSSSIIRGVKAPTAVMKASGRTGPRSTTALAGVQVATSGQSASAASASITTSARKPNPRACRASASALAWRREAMRKSCTPSTAAKASTCACPCTPAPTTNIGPARFGASRRAARAETAAVRRAVMVGPSRISRRVPVATSNTVTSP